ncbi:MAG TPA: histidine kinase, partial [Edaphobacter sp.]|nr:histidine kinase [Edaphobacter sp.]
MSAIFAFASLLAGMTARECHTNFAYHHTAMPVSFVPSVLFGSATWFWWAGIVISLWLYARHRPAFLHFSGRWGIVHLVIGCGLAVPHLVLLQHTILFDSIRWPAWGAVYSTLYLYTLRRYGLELVIYGFIYVFSCLFYSQFQTQQTMMEKLEIERQLTHAQLQRLQMQMEPHFLFNTLNAITSLMVQGRNKEAIKTMTHLNTILRTTLQRKSPEKVPFVEELRIVESYLAIQQVRFAGRLDVKIDVTPEALDGLVPYFLLQPLVENAIQHGITPLETGGSIETHVKRLGDILRIEVKDNGRGPIGSGTKGHGIGMQNIRERLAYFYPGAYEFNAVAPVGGGY